jgi:hypothetical protein
MMTNRLFVAVCLMVATGGVSVAASDEHVRGIVDPFGLVRCVQVGTAPANTKLIEVTYEKNVAFPDSR